MKQLTYRKPSDNSIISGNSYTYDANNDRPIYVYQTNIAALYHSYDSKGRIQQINRKSKNYANTSEPDFWQAYFFDYDAWGNTTKVRVWKPTDDDDIGIGEGGIKLAEYS